jgi:hypothetical protein
MMEPFSDRLIDVFTQTYLNTYFLNLVLSGIVLLGFGFFLFKSMKGSDFKKQLQQKILFLAGALLLINGSAFVFDSQPIRVFERTDLSIVTQEWSNDLEIKASPTNPISKLSSVEGNLSVDSSLMDIAKKVIHMSVGNLMRHSVNFVSNTVSFVITLFELLMLIGPILALGLALFFTKLFTVFLFVPKYQERTVQSFKLVPSTLIYFFLGCGNILIIGTVIHTLNVASFTTINQPSSGLVVQVVMGLLNSLLICIVGVVGVTTQLAISKLPGKIVEYVNTKMQAVQSQKLG